MVPGPKARMQVRRTTRALRSARCFNGARPEGQDAGEVERQQLNRGPKLQWCPARRPGCRGEDAGGGERHADASMVPGPKARMQAARGRLQRTSDRSFNGARPEGQDAGGGVPSRFRACIYRLQWCPARRPGCRLSASGLTVAQLLASMVPGPKARMQDPPDPPNPARQRVLQWCPARRPGCRRLSFVPGEGIRGVLQWCPARRPGCRRR